MKGAKVRCSELYEEAGSNVKIIVFCVLGITDLIRKRTVDNKGVSLIAVRMNVLITAG